MRELDYEILIKYLDGDCTKEEMQLVGNWLEFPDSRKEFELMQKIWSVDSPKLLKPDVEKALDNVWGKIREQVRPQVPTADIYRLDFPEKQSSFTQFFKETSILKAAAAIIIFFIAAYSIGRFVFSTDTINITVEKAQIRTIVLDDGSKATLDAGSKFSYPEKFTGETRTVSISGEGFFEVAHNADQPFIVETGNAKITVVGTKFNISAWQESNSVSVAVSEGKVSFVSEESDSAPVFISRGFESSMIAGQVPSEPIEIDINSVASWQNKEKTFSSVPLKEILSQLERWYNLRFVLPSNSYYNEVVTIHITNSPLNEILDLIAAVMEFSYSQSGNEIHFLKKDASL